MSSRLMVMGGRAIALRLSPWVVIGFFALLASQCYAPTSPDGSQADDAFSAERAHTVMERVLGSEPKPRPVGSAEGKAVAGRIQAELETLGIESEIHGGLACGRYRTCAHVRNVVARVDGTAAGDAAGTGTSGEEGADVDDGGDDADSESDASDENEENDEGGRGSDGRPVVALTAHYDSVHAGPGVADDAHGVAVLLEIARIVAASPRHADVIFLFTDGEEVGMLGAEHFVAEHPWAADLDYVVNVEARGTSGPSILFELAGAASPVVSTWDPPRPITTSMARPVYEMLQNDTDLSVFRDAGIPGANLAFIGGVVRYHTPLDDVEHLERASLQHQGENALALLDVVASGELDVESLAAPGEAAAEESGVFFDFYGATIISWGPGVSLILAGLAVLLALVAVFGATRRAGVRGNSVALAALMWAVVVVGLIGTHVGLTWMFVQLDALALRVPFPASPGWIVLAEIGLFVLTVAVLARGLGRRLGALDWLLAATLWWSIGGLVAAWMFEPGSYLFVLPALIMSVATVAAVFVGERSARAPVVAGFVGLAGAAALLMPVCWLLFDLAGYGPISPGLPLLALLVPSVLVIAAGPAQLPGKIDNTIGMLPLLIGVIGAVFASPYGADTPLHLNVLRHEHTPGPQQPVEARWFATTLDAELPAGLREAAPFTDTPTLPTPWSRQIMSGYEAFTDPIDLPTPEAEVIGREQTSELVEGAREVVVRLVSRRGAPIGAVYSQDPGVVAIGVGDQLLEGEGRAGWRGVDLPALPPDGIELRVVIRGEAEASLIILDQSLGRPEGSQKLFDAVDVPHVPVQTGHSTIVTRGIQL